MPAIPRSKDPHHTRDDLNVFDFELVPEDMAELNAARSPPPADGPKADCAIP